MIFVLNHLWQSTIFAGAMGLLSLVLRNNSAQARYRIWLIASLKFLLPFSLLVAAGGAIHWQHETSKPQFTSAVRQAGRAFEPVAQASYMSDVIVPGPKNALSKIFFVAWLTGSLIVISSRFRRWVRVRAIVRSARQLPAEIPIPVLECPSLLEPGIFGVFRPVLLLPAGITEHLPSAHLKTILAHELCHVRRRDNLVSALHMLMEALFWFHPLVWWIGARLVEERECACDEEVLRQGNAPVVYAESILKVCQFYLASPLPCVSGVTGSDLKQRVVRIMAERRSVRLNLRQKLMLAAAATVAIALPLTIGSTNAAQAGSEPSFEVASVKPDKAADLTAANSSWSDRPGTLTATGVSLKTLIERAYRIKDYQLHGPSWFDSERYDISARWLASAPDGDLPLMLQSLLKERFNLTIHREEKQLPVYKLRVSKTGPRLQRSRYPDGHSSLHQQRSHFSAQHLNMEQLANALSQQTGRPVFDETGLPGYFDFELQFSSDDAPESGSNDPSLFTAVEEQLGLRLILSKGLVDTVIVDHVEKVPTEN